MQWPMRLLIVDTYYPAFVDAHYAAQPALRGRPYSAQLASLMARSFGTSDAYSHHLNELGLEAVEIIANAEPLQRAWAQQHGSRRLSANPAWLLPGRAGTRARRQLVARIARQQIEQFDPDVVYVQDMGWMSPAELERARAGGRRLVVGQIASPLPPDDVVRGYDLVLTSFPHFVERIKGLGVDARYFKLAFDQRVGERLGAAGVATDPDADRPHGVAFVGGLSPRVHRAGTALLERLAEALPIDAWGYGAEALVNGSALRNRYRGEAWGLDMYRVLARSRIVVNRHIDVAEGYANNMRLYEATGVGALVVTESAPNLGDLFEPDREVVTYSDLPELRDKLEHLLAHDDERRAIAAAGQARTLRDHTYRRRMQELIDVLEPRVR
jgi:spore maturation protein CgeB